MDSDLYEFYIEKCKFTKLYRIGDIFVVGVSVPMLTLVFIGLAVSRQISPQAVKLKRLYT